MKQLNNLSKSEKMLNKVPEVTIFFWIIKILCTTVGETAADFLNINQFYFSWRHTTNCNIY